MTVLRDTAPISDDRGEITLVGLGMLLAAVAAVYLAWMWIPVYVVHFEVEQVVRRTGNEAVKDSNDPQLIATMVARLQGLDSQTLAGEDGQRHTVPTVNVAAEDITWERSSDQHRLRVAFDYRRAVPFPLVDRVLERTMSVDLTMDISRPEWGTSR